MDNNGMNIQLLIGEKSDQIKFDRLMQLYLYDFTEYLDINLNGEGLFEENILADYFSNPTKVPYLIIVDNMPVGFVLISQETLLNENAGGRCIKEFFIIRRFRRKGIGKIVATVLLCELGGKWEIRVVKSNTTAMRFWEEVVNNDSLGKYNKQEKDDDIWRGCIFSVMVE